MKLKTVILIITIVVLLVVIKVFFIKPENAVTNKGATPKVQAVNVTGFIVKPEVLENKIYSSGLLSQTKRLI